MAFYNVVLCFTMLNGRIPFVCFLFNSVLVRTIFSEAPLINNGCVAHVRALLIFYSAAAPNTLSSPSQVLKAFVRQLRCGPGAAPRLPPPPCSSGGPASTRVPEGGQMATRSPTPTPHCRGLPVHSASVYLVSIPGQCPCPVLTLVLCDESQQAAHGQPGACYATVVHGGLSLDGRGSVLQTVWLRPQAACAWERGVLFLPAEPCPGPRPQPVGRVSSFGFPLHPHSLLDLESAHKA